MVQSSPYAYGADLEGRVRAHLARHERRAEPLAGRTPAAVALALVPDASGDASFLLTRRAPRLRSHAGQWALPGGRLEPGESAADGALRELAEEVGLLLPEESVVGVLDDYATRSGYVITPIVVWAGEVDELTPDPEEVAAVYHVPLAVLDAPGVPRLRRIPESDRPVISVRMVDSDVHAPTAAIVYQLREVAMHGRPTRVAHFEQPVFAWR